MWRTPSLEHDIVCPRFLQFVWAFRPETLAEERWQPGDAAPEWRRAPGVVTITTGPDSRQTTVRPQMRS